MNLFINIGKLVDDLSASFPKYRFSISTGLSEWQFPCIYVEYNGYQVGRVKLRPVEREIWTLYSVKRYKPWNYEYDPADDFFYAFETWFDTGVVIDMKPLVAQAKKNREEKIAGIMAWREANPKAKSRPPVSKSWNGELYRLVMAEHDRVVVQTYSARYGFSNKEMIDFD